MVKLFIIGSFILDFLFGDPPLIFKHPIIIIGNIITIFEKYFLKIKNKIFGGFLFTIFVIFLTLFFVKILIFLFSFFNKYIDFLLTVILGSFTISLRSLHYETLKVYNCLKKRDIENAKQQLSFLVSRDTANLDEKNILRSTIETISENITDGIIAPLFYFALGGILGAFFYKTVNTLDSMIGYKNKKYIDFGKFAAKLDDILNFIPARITGVIIVIASFILRYDYKNSYRIMLRDYNKTDSPNSGFSESAVAGALNIRLGGPTSYFGRIENKPFIGDEKEELNIKHIEKSYKLMYTSSFIFIILLMAILK